METKNDYTILVAEDDKFLKKVFKSKLQKEKYTIIEANDGNQAYELALRRKPDIILTDIIMPLFDGNALIKKLKENPITKDIPVLVLTNLSQEKDRKIALELGAVEFIVKSDISFNDVITIVHKYLGE